MGQRGSVVQVISIACIVAVALAAHVATRSATAVLASVAIVALIVMLVVWRVGVKQSRQHRQTEQILETELDQARSQWNALREEAQQTTNALSKMRDGVVLLSRTDEVLLFNPAARRLLSIVGNQNLLGRQFSEVVRHPELNRAVADAHAGDGEQTWMIEMPNGDTMRPLEVTIDRFTQVAEGDLLMTLHDETESHRVEEMRREFVANISHELKTPLAAIKGYAETVELAIKDDPEAATHFMAQINTQCVRLEHLVSDMMMLARAQAGNENLLITDVSIADVIAESMKSYRPVAEAKNLNVSVDLADDVCVRSDQEATLTIANNLIGNAIRYTPEGGQVRVTCERAGAVGSLIVEDTGVGIPAGEQDRVFERFYRVEKNRSAETSGNRGGTGIGLSVVKNLTMTLGGEIRLSSEPGKGSRFEVWLPIANQ